MPMRTRVARNARRFGPERAREREGVRGTAGAYRSRAGGGTRPQLGGRHGGRSPGQYTVPPAGPDFPVFFAVIVTGPAATPATAPVRETVAVWRLDVDQPHWRVMSRVRAGPVKVPVAVS